MPPSTSAVAGNGVSPGPVSASAVHFRLELKNPVLGAEPDEWFLRLPGRAFPLTLTRSLGRRCKTMREAGARSTSARAKLCLSRLHACSRRRRRNSPAARQASAVYCCIEQPGDWIGSPTGESPRTQAPAGLIGSPSSSPTFRPASDRSSRSILLRTNGLSSISDLSLPLEGL